MYIRDKSLLYIHYITPTSKFSLFFRRCVEMRKGPPYYSALRTIKVH